MLPKENLESHLISLRHLFQVLPQGAHFRQPHRRLDPLFHRQGVAAAVPSKGEEDGRIKGERRNRDGRRMTDTAAPNSLVLQALQLPRVRLPLLGGLAANEEDLFGIQQHAGHRLGPCARQRRLWEEKGERGLS